MIRVLNIKMQLDHTKNSLISKVAKILNIQKDCIESFSIAKRSIDARNKNNIVYIYSVDVKLKSKINISQSANIQFIQEEHAKIKRRTPTQPAPIIIGAGPAGLFAAWQLAQSGLNPIIIERGKSVEERLQDVDHFFKTGELDESSNIQFGEGGAGTFSDGKLTTGINDIRIRKVLKLFVDMGAPEEILYDAKPHIGTDKLLVVLKNLRREIISLGGQFYFQSKLIAIHEKNCILTGIEVEDKYKNIMYMEANRLILAIGHSARDTFKMLKSSNIEMQSKPFAVGVRIEHKRDMINKSQYGKYATKLPAASYKLSTRLKDGRGIYTFCMCPGGVVVAASSEKGHLAVNGMSYYKRDAVNSNSAILVSVSQKDFGTDDIFAGIDFQRKLERQAYKIGNNYNAPIQLVGDFLNDVQSKRIGDIEPSYKPATILCDLREALPKFIVDALKQGIKDMDTKLKGFMQHDAILTAVESRSSSPITILRDQQFYSNIKGIMPCGEGSGYAGGIMSAAVDGLKVAEALIDN